MNHGNGHLSLAKLRKPTLCVDGTSIPEHPLLPQTLMSYLQVVNVVAPINLPLFQQPLGTSLETPGSRKEVHAVQDTVIVHHIWPQCDYALPSDVAWEVW
jgi:hypothetical protein